MALRTIRSGASSMVEDVLVQFLTDLINLSGIFDVKAGQFAVTNGSGLSVNIAVGRAYLKATNGNGYPIVNTASITNQAINSNSSGNPRITSVVLYQDLGASPNSDASNVAKIMMVDGTPASSPSAPSLATIQSAVGSGNPYTILDDVRVNSGATSPTSHDFSRVQQVKFRTDIFNSDDWVTYNPTASSTLTLDLALGKKFQINLPNGSVTLALKNVPLNCKSILLRFTQPSSGTGSVTFWSGLNWPGGTVITLTNTTNKSDEVAVNFLTVTDDTTNTSEAVVVHQNV